MSLGIAFKGPEGIVLAADSRVTLNTEKKNGDIITVHSAYYDNATKLLRVAGQDFVGAVTYGIGSLGSKEPRTAHSFLPEFEEILASEGNVRLPVSEFATKFSDFFYAQWKALMPSEYSGVPLIFLIGGYNKDSAYGEVYEVALPYKPTPIEVSALSKGRFGMVWGGQGEYAARLINGFDENVIGIVREIMEISGEKENLLRKALSERLITHIPYQFLPLQDCVDFAIFLIRTTAELQKISSGLRGVGGAIDVATITRTDGFKYVQKKDICGERSASNPIISPTWK